MKQDNLPLINKSRHYFDDINRDYDELYGLTEFNEPNEENLQGLVALEKCIEERIQFEENMIAKHEADLVTENTAPEKMKELSQNASHLFLKVAHNIIPQTPISKINLSRYDAHHASMKIVHDNTKQAKQRRKDLIIEARINEALSDMMCNIEWWYRNDLEDFHPGSDEYENQVTSETELNWVLVHEDDHPDRIREKWHPHYEEIKRQRQEKQRRQMKFA